MKPKNKLLASLILLSFFVAPALGVSVSYSAGDGGRSVSSSTSYNLDDSASLQEDTMLLDSELYQTRQAGGSGTNSIKQQVSGNGYKIDNIMDSTGSFGISTSTAASSDGAGLSQQVAGSGDLSTGLYASTGLGFSSQEAGVSDGSLATSQGVAAAGGVYTSQRTDLAGETGSIGSSSLSKENSMVVTGGFSGQGDLKADLSSLSAGRAAMIGDASFVGVPVLDSGNLQAVASGDIAMSVDGLYAEPEGDLGTFEINAINVEKDQVNPASTVMQLPTYTSDGGRKEAYLLAGWRWNTKNPRIKFYVKNDANLRNKGLNPTSVAAAIGRAANTWDAATSQNLFSDTGVTVSSSVGTDTRDGYNVAAWKYLSSAPSALAYSRTWYTLNKQGTPYYSALESDLSFNTRYGWSTSGSNYDVESVALHELGHTIGLGDLYGKSKFTNDKRQVMHYYTGIKRTLGNGDKNGAWILYG